MVAKYTMVRYQEQNTILKLQIKSVVLNILQTKINNQLGDKHKNLSSLTIEIFMGS